MDELREVLSGALRRHLSWPAYRGQLKLEYQEGRRGLSQSRARDGAIKTPTPSRARIEPGDHIRARLCADSVVQITPGVSNCAVGVGQAPETSARLARSTPPLTTIITTLVQGSELQKHDLRLRSCETSQ